MRKTLANAKKDPRVYEIVRVNSEEFREENIRYFINLADGYELDDGSATAYVCTVAEIWEVLDNEVVKVEDDEE